MLLYEDLLDMYDVVKEYYKILCDTNSLDRVQDLRLRSLQYLIEHELGMNEED